MTTAVECYSNICCDESGGGGGGTITGGTNIGTGDEVFAGVVGTDLTFRTLIAGSGMTINQTADELEFISTGGFDPADNYATTGIWLNSGHWTFTGQFDINSTVDTEIITSANLHLEGNLTGGSHIFRGGNIDVTATQGNLGLRSDTNDVFISANSGQMNIHGQSTVISSDTTFDIFNSNGGIQINTNTGNFNVFAGTGPTPGEISLGATDNINIFSNDGSISLTSSDPTIGNVALNAISANLNIGVPGIFGGVGAGSGLTIDAVTGDVSFGASTGTFLLGALANTVDILAGTVMTLSAATTLDLSSPMIVMELITDTAPVVLPPVISLPSGFKYLVIDENAGPNQYRIYKMG